MLDGPIIVGGASIASGGGLRLETTIANRGASPQAEH